MIQVRALITMTSGRRYVQVWTDTDLDELERFDAEGEGVIIQAMLTSTVLRIEHEPIVQRHRENTTRTLRPGGVRWLHTRHIEDVVLEARVKPEAPE